MKFPRNIKLSSHCSCSKICLFQVKNNKLECILCPPQHTHNLNAPFEAKTSYLCTLFKCEVYFLKFRSIQAQNVHGWLYVNTEAPSGEWIMKPDSSTEFAKPRHAAVAHQSFTNYCEKSLNLEWFNCIWSLFQGHFKPKIL